MFAADGNTMIAGTTAMSKTRDIAIPCPTLVRRGVLLFSWLSFFTEIGMRMSMIGNAHCHVD